MANHQIAIPRLPAGTAQSFSLLVLLGALAWCGVSCSSTKVVSFTNTKVDSQAPLTSVVTVMVDPRSYVRAAVEGHLTGQLKRSGVEAYPSYTKVASEDLEGTLETTFQKLSVFGAEAVLLCRLTDRTDISQPASFKSNKADWKQAWTSESVQSTAFEADTWGGEVTVNLHMESKLYRLDNAELLWVGYAETKLGETTDDLKRIKAVSEKIVSQLSKDGLVR